MSFEIIETTDRNTGKPIHVTVNGNSLSYLDEGPVDARTILFIHGFPFDKSMWQLQIDAFKEEFRTIAYDVRGHGDSELGESKSSIELYGKDLIDLLDHLKLEKVIVCGLSMGGYIALHAVTRYPNRFHALILSDTQCQADSPESIANRLKTIEKIKATGVEDFANASLLNLFAPESFTKNLDQINLIRSMIVNTSVESLCYNLMAIAERNDTCDKLADIKLPALILVGKEDRITPPALSRVMNSKITASLMVTIPFAGHLPNMENPEEFNKQIKLFVSSIK